MANIKWDELPEGEEYELNNIAWTWNEIGLSTDPSDRSTAEYAIAGLYELCGYKKPKFLWIDSPFAGIVAQVLLSNVEGRGWETALEEGSAKRGCNELGEPVRGELECLRAGTITIPLSRNISVDLTADCFCRLWLLHRLVPPRHEWSWHKMKWHIEDQIADNIWNDLWHQSPIRHQARCRRKVFSLLENTLFGQHECEWIGIAYQALRAGVTFPPGMVEHLDRWAAIARSCGWWWPYSKTVIISEKPELISTDWFLDDYRRHKYCLHNEEGFAVRFRDGYSMCCLNGVRVMPEMVWWPGWRPIDQENLNHCRRRIILDVARKIGIDSRSTLFGDALSQPVRVGEPSDAQESRTDWSDSKQRAPKWSRLYYDLDESELGKLEILFGHWDKIALCTTPADRPAAEQAIAELYSLAGYETPEFLWADSPAEGLLTLLSQSQCLGPRIIDLVKARKSGTWWDWWRTEFSRALHIEQHQRLGRLLLHRHYESPLSEEVRGRRGNWYWEFPDRRHRLSEERMAHVIFHWPPIANLLRDQIRAHDWWGFRPRRLNEDKFISHFEGWRNLWQMIRGQVRQHLEDDLDRYLRDAFEGWLRELTEDEFAREIRSLFSGRIWPEGRLRDEAWSDIEEEHIRKQEEQERHSLDAKRQDSMRLLSEDFYNAVMDQIWENGFGPGDFDWIAYARLREKLGSVYTPMVEQRLKLWNVIAESCGWWWAYEKYAIVCERPESISCAGEGSTLHFHSDTGPAVRYRDGFSMWCLNGVRVTKEFVETPADRLDPRLLLKESNVEVRREIVRKIGIERLCAELAGDVLDSDGTYQLINLDLGDGRRRPYLKMLNPSSGTWHLEGVPAYIRTVGESLAWRNQTDVHPRILT